ncbi:DUF2812 domain-containing protein [Planococcus beigongshangi]|uniref:DUF2812 domain-containing protein n=1 Tax=Planococcus beigongshangi TaxID=2782536 RepID=UPI00193B1D1E|nr:DUF2812 domain-containing protein [Planococcus beigongshangi]
MKKFRMFMDIQKEENWLNEMAQQGWLCKRVSSLGIYHFEKTTATDQVIRIDYQTFRSKAAKERYIELYEEYGWTHLGGRETHYWLKPADGMDELFSDDASQKAYLRRLLEYYGALCVVFFVMTITTFNNFSQYRNPKDAYFTPGLWDKEGFDFLFAFLFETPFAVARFGAPWFFLLCLALLYTMYGKYLTRIKKIEKAD